MKSIRLGMVVIGLAMAAFLSGAEVLTKIYVHEGKFLPRETIVRLSGLCTGNRLDSGVLDEAYRYLMMSDCFDTVMVQKAVLSDSTAAVHIFVRENKKSNLGFYGGMASLTMYGRDKLWFAITPGYERRFLFNRPQALVLTLTFPYAYGASAAWSAASCPWPRYNCGLSVQGRSTPYQYSRYYVNSLVSSAYLERMLTSRLGARLSGAYELSKTWRVDETRWEKLDWQVAILDAGDIEDPLYAGIYPRTEAVPSLAVSASFDRRNNSLYPSRGYSLFAEARHFWVNNEDDDYHFQFNQATGSAKLYLNPFRKHVVASHLKFIVRDNFDPMRLGHRLIFYDEGLHFRGFNTLAGENLGFLNLEYRVRLFDMDFTEGLEELNLSPKMQKLVRKMNYFAEGFLFVDNGLFFGNVYLGKSSFVPFSSVSFTRDVFTSAGLGGRLVYPGLGYVATAGFTAYQHKADLDQDYTARFFGTLSLPF